MSVERQVSRALWRMTFFRLLGDIVSAPRHVCNALVMLFQTVGSFFGSIERTIFTLEVDASRRYRALTGVDLALAVGEPTRYSGARVGIADLRDSRMLGQVDEDE